MAPDSEALVAEADRLSWLAGKVAVLNPPAGASSAVEGHPMGPEALVAVLAPAIRDLHAIDVSHCPFDTGVGVLRSEIARRLEYGLIEPATEGAYSGRTPESLVAVFDEIIAKLDSANEAVMIHGAIGSEYLWFDPNGGVTLTNWRRAGVGDRHLDLAAIAVMLTHLYGPALVGPFFEAYGFDHVDLVRLDAFQLLAHLLS